LASFSLDQLDDASQPDAPRVVESILERRGISRQIWKALQAMSSTLREAVVLRYLAGMRYREIGETLRCNPKTAESRVRLGVEALRRALRQSDAADELDWVELPVW
jgi:RNA polymerase sigma factor (sigma-70 family)